VTSEIDDPPFDKSLEERGNNPTQEHIKRKLDILEQESSWKLARG